METQDIQNLLNKFYQGETSSEEEALLTSFFRKGNVPEEWDKDRLLVQMLSESETEIPNELEQKIETFIDSLAASEETKNKQRTKIAVWKYVAGIAASLLIIFGIGLRYQSQKNNKSLLIDTYQTPEQAQKATLEALQLFSQHFSKGVKPLEKAEKHIEETHQIVRRTLNK